MKWVEVKRKVISETASFKIFLSWPKLTPFRLSTLKDKPKNKIWNWVGLSSFVFHQKDPTNLGFQVKEVKTGWPLFTKFWQDWIMLMKKSGRNG